MAKQISYVCVAAQARSETEASRFIIAATLFILAGRAHTRLGCFETLTEEVSAEKGARRQAA